MTPNLYAALASRQTPVLCRHCRYSQWSGRRQQLIGTCPRLRGGACPNDAHVCFEFSREPGADDDLE